MAEALRMIRLALLEADVNYKVVKDLVERFSRKPWTRKSWTA
jgi:signal recognition particle GTPase